MADLHWFPAYVDKWLSSPAIQRMLPEQEGAYWRLLLLCWGAGDTEPSLPADDLSLAQMSRLGARWKRLGALIREQFEERDGKLYNSKLSEVWREQQIKHGVAVANGRKGGQKKAENKRTRTGASSPARSQLQAEQLANVQHLEQEGTLVGPTDPTSSPSPFALGAEAPRSGEARQMDESGTSGMPTTLGAELQKFAPNIIPMHRRRA